MESRDLAGYEGAGLATLASGQTVPVKFRVYQQANCDLSGSCELTDDSLVYEQVAAIQGTTADGWSVSVQCPTYQIPLFPWQSSSLSPQSIFATAPNSGSAAPVRLSAPLLNLKFPHPHQWWQPELSWQGEQINISPVADYTERIEQLEGSNGILQTAVLSLSTISNLSAEAMWDLLKDITTPLSLATGRLVCIAGVDMEDAQGGQLVRFHANAIRHPYRTHADGFGLTTNPKKMVAGWDAYSSNLISQDHLRRRIHQFLDAVLSTLFIDSRAMLAACFLDAFSTEYCMAAYNRKPVFQQRLEMMVHDLGIDITTTPDICKDVKDSRNNLIHEGKFVTGANGTERAWETIQAHWLAFAFLTRLIDRQVGIRPIYDLRTQAGTIDPVIDYNL